ncbi:MAG: hypothetical protein CMB67_04430 [Euryarchaeota archaeon]|nr:hypothetical protein [Euryarchaeota archaeon]|tara:strand:- start:2304 stop:3110 length:807 start_codon:yes stop_codon:yes gene_type:complete
MSYLENALKIAGLPTNGSRQDKIDRLVKNGAKNNNAPKPTISKAAGKKNISSTAKKSHVKGSDSKDKLDFFRDNVSKVSGTMSEKRKKLEAMWSAVDNPTPPQDKYSIFEEELETDFAISMGLKKVGEKDGKHVYKAIDAPTSSSKTDNPSPVSSPKPASSKASPKGKASPKKADNEDAEDDGADSFRIFQCWLGSLSKPTLVAIAQDKKISVTGNKPDLVAKLMTSTGVTENDDSDSDSDSGSSDSDGDGDGDEDDDEDDEDDEDEE